MIKKRKSLSFQVLQRTVVSNVIVYTIFGICLVILLIYYFLNTFSDSRISSLKQSTYSLGVIKSAISSMSDEALDSLNEIVSSSTNDDFVSGYLTSKTVLDNVLKDPINSMNAVGFDMSVDIVTADEKFYSSNPLYESSLKSFTSSMWFLDMVYSNTEQNSKGVWSIRTIDPSYHQIVVLSYSRAILDNSGKVIGVLIVNINNSVLYETYSALINDNSNNTVHIIDEDGLIISHPNQALIGFSLYGKSYLNNMVKDDFSKFEISNGNIFYVTTLFDKSTGWFIIEKLPIYSLIKLVYPVFIAIIIVIICSFLLSYFIVSRMTKNTFSRLSLLNAYMKDFKTEKSIYDHFPILDSDCTEVYNLGIGFNEMKDNMSNLVKNIKTVEIEKRQIEFNFLQAQIDPHFLHNTLLAIKALIILKNKQQSLDMIQAFISLVKNPINANNPMVNLDSELSSVADYIHIMEYRYDTKFELIVNILDNCHNVKIPRMTLQPIIENCIFHGFAANINEKSQKIVVDCYSGENGCTISIKDNGKGMTEEQLADILISEKVTNESFNHISMGNILKRLKWTFGNDTDMKIESTLGQGTNVIIEIPLSLE